MIEFSEMVNFKIFTYKCMTLNEEIALLNIVN